MMHIVELPELEFKACVHKPTVQKFAILPVAGSVETTHGTMTFRQGDSLMVGADGHTLYCLTPEAFAAAYEVAE